MGENSGLGGLADKAKGAVSDEQIEDAAEKLKEKAPEQAHGAVDAAVDQAKKYND